MNQSIKSLSFNMKSNSRISSSLSSTTRSFSSQSINLNQSQSQPQPPSSNSSSFFNPPPPKHQRPSKAPLSSLDPSSASYRHRSFYSEILPPFLRVLAYGSASYFALHLTWNLLNDEQIKKGRVEELQDLQKVVKSNREKVLNLREQNGVDQAKGNEIEVGNANGKGKSWWKFW